MTRAFPEGRLSILDMTDRPQIRPETRSRLTNDKLTLLETDGRTRRARRLRDLREMFRAELGEELTQAQRSTVDRLALVTMQLDAQQSHYVAGDDAFDADRFLQLARIEARLLASLGLIVDAPEPRGEKLEDLIGAEPAEPTPKAPTSYAPRGRTLKRHKAKERTRV